MGPLGPTTMIPGADTLCRALTDRHCTLAGFGAESLRAAAQWEGYLEYLL
jgi:hypothetical protein